MPSKKASSSATKTQKDAEQENDLYGLLEVPSTASAAEIKKAYYKLALKFHPDRAANKDNATATAQFQRINRAYSILGDDNKRRVFDKTGSCGDDDISSSNMTEDEWTEYWRALYPKISVADVKEFEKKYKGSKEERKDLLEAYQQFKGSYDVIMENVILAEDDDLERFREIIQEEIDAGSVKLHLAFKKWPLPTSKKVSARKRKAEKEAGEAEEMAKTLGIAGKDEEGLRKMIVERRKNDFGSMMARLEARYCDTSSKSTKRKKK